MTSEVADGLVSVSGKFREFREQATKRLNATLVTGRLTSSHRLLVSVNLLTGLARPDPQLTPGTSTRYRVLCRSDRRGDSIQV